MKTVTRRDFMKNSIAAGVVVALPFSHVRGANDRIHAGVVGLGGRGTGAHIPSFEKQKGVTVVAVSDPDRERMGKAAK
ncbi:MAG: twin-arginine translocation signal domain-containing protein, partial [Planctomycetota bacterium]